MSTATRLSIAIWALAALCGSLYLANYSSEPGVHATAIDEWPADATVARNLGGLTLVVFLHPHCPCSRATIRELARIVAQLPRNVQISAWFYQPSHLDSSWSQSSLRDSAAAIPLVQVGTDVDARDARRFGVTTSGHALLFNVQGRCLYSGGITAGRGHEGDNPGKTALLELAAAPSHALPNDSHGTHSYGSHSYGSTERRGQSDSTVQTRPVYGCSILHETPVVASTDATEVRPPGEEAAK
ncbi:MAG: RedB protein [Planctomycetota bacterium]